MKMISYWKNYKNIYKDDEGQVIIVGEYDHFNEGNPRKALGVHWTDYPTSRGVLAPCVLSGTNANALLLGLLNKALAEEKEDVVDNLIDAIKYLRK